MIIAASLLFTLLYKYNNKYTGDSPQPINGIWDLATENFSDRSMYYPIYDWEFYPDKLLTPADFAKGHPDMYTEYVTIGERTSILRDSAFGKGTYRLNILLPERRQTYLLYLPEVFNSCRLYADEELLLDMGNVDTGKAEIQDRAVTFAAAGKVQLMLEVNSTSHFYSGMVYPPVFGSQTAVNTARGWGMLIAIFVMAIAFVCFLVALWLGFRMHQRYVRLFAAVCAAVALYVCCPMIHALIPVSGNGTYTLEITSYYAIFLMLIMINNNQCGIPRPCRIISTGIAAAVCVAAALFSLLSSEIGLGTRSVFSAVFTAYKWCTAAYLLTAAAYALYTKKRFSLPILCGSVFFAMSLIFDRIFPLYEPIYGGWFAEVGGLVLIVASGYAVCNEIAESYRFNLILAEQKSQLDRRIMIQKAQYEAINDKIEETVHLRHDMRQHFRVIRAFLNKESYKELSDYINTLENTNYELSPLTLCQNPLVDAILQYYRNVSIRQGIEFDVQFTAPKTIRMAEGDISIILGNLLENAYEACCKVKEKGITPYIKISGVCDDKKLKFRIINSSVGKPQITGNRIYSTKHEGEGIGIHSIRAVVERHSEIIEITPQEETFTISVIIPL